MNVCVCLHVRIRKHIHHKRAVLGYITNVYTKTIYGVASVSRLLKITGLFCTRAVRYSAKETYDFKEPSNRSHPIPKKFLCSQPLQNTHTHIYSSRTHLFNHDSADGSDQIKRYVSNVAPYVSVCACMWVCVGVYVCVYVWVCVFVCMCVWVIVTHLKDLSPTSPPVCVCVHVCGGVCLCAYVCG